MTRPVFSSRAAVLLTMIGVSVGLGNVWRFPYMMGQYGGSAFLLVYLLLTLAFAIPALMAEWALGRATRSGPVGAFSRAFGPAVGRTIGLILLITILVADSYYVVVIANIVYAAGFTLFRGFDGLAMTDYRAGLQNGALQYVLALALMLASLYVIHRGLRRGIEVVSRWIVPFFLVVIVWLVISAFRLDGAMVRVAEFLRPDFSAMGARELFAALGQSFFSIGLGGTFMLMYGSYLGDKGGLGADAVLTAFGDTAAALLAALFIVPTVLVFGLDLGTGPGLVLETLPQLFQNLSGGRLLGGLFLLALAMVAFLSNIAALEVLVGGAADFGGAAANRTRVIPVVALVQAPLIAISAFRPEMIAILDLIFGSGMQVAGSLMALLALTWGLGKRETIRQVFSHEDARFQSFYFHWVRWVVPGALLTILLLYLRSALAGH